MHRPFPIILLLLMLVPPGVALGEVYRWVDDSGRVHFSDKPHGDHGEKIELLEPPPTPQTAPQKLPDRERLLQMYEQERRERQAVKAQRDRDRAHLKQQCQKVENTLRRYLAGGPLYDVQPDGTRRFYTAAEKDQELAKLRGVLKRHCGGVPADLR
jgi:hypothetical protein